MNADQIMTAALIILARVTNVSLDTLRTAAIVDSRPLLEPD